MKRSVVMVILAGWGLSENHEGNPLSSSSLTNFSGWLKSSVAGALTTSGPALGLDWQKAISIEEGFSIIGAGRGLESFSLENPAQNTLSEILSKNNLTQIRISEEIYEHPISFCFDGFKEIKNPNEFRIYLPTQKTPALNVVGLRDRATLAIRDSNHSFILINFGDANTTAKNGDFTLTSEAALAVDRSLGVLAEEAKTHNCEFVVVGSHGNVEVVLNRQTGLPDLNDNANPVPIIFPLHSNNKPNSFSERLGLLSDVAPTILGLLGINKPPEMTGENLAPRLGIIK